jgi:Redoxin.
MKRKYPKVELIANVLIIIVAVLLAVVVVQRLINKPNSNQSPRLDPSIGSRLNLSDVDWSKHPKTLIMALQTRCHFCNESAPFYKRLIESAQHENVKLVAVFPTGKEEGVEHLKGLGLTNLDVKQAPLESLQVSGTPTLILTDRKGEITNYWVGRLTPDKETDVIAHLR